MMNYNVSVNTPEEIFRQIARLEFIEDTAGAPTIITSFSDLMSMEFDDGEEIAFHAMRGELVLVQSVTNKGKSTLVRNAAFALATGNALAPIVEAGEPRKVLLLNMEGSGSRFRNDLAAMCGTLTDDEIRLAGENFFPTHAPEIEDVPVSLSVSKHVNKLELEAEKHSIDVIIIDTASASFAIGNENDNSEVANHVLKPLLRLARKLNCVVVLVHHIGKARLEEGTTQETAHRGRGASAWADFPTSIFNLEADPKDQKVVRVFCAKQKNGDSYTVTMRLNPFARWFSLTMDSACAPQSRYELFSSQMSGTMKRSEIIEAAAAVGIPEGTAEKYMVEAERLGHCVKKERGIYEWQDFPTSSAPNRGGGNRGNLFDED